MLLTYYRKQIHILLNIFFNKFDFLFLLAIHLKLNIWLVQ
jgi:hypothetical protein